MTLPYPFKIGERAAVSAVIKSPTGSTLADARRAADNGEIYSALLAYVAGSVASFSMDDGSTIEGREAIKSASRDLPWFLAEWIAFRSMLKAGAQDDVDIVFACPRCANEYYRDDPVLVSGMTMKESPVIPMVAVELSEPVQFLDAKTGEPVETVESLVFRLPTLGDCIKAASKIGVRDDTRLQYAIWAEAIVSVNDEDIDQKWRGPWGNQVFERMEIQDVRSVSNGMAEWGIDNTVEAMCPKCGKQYRQGVPTGSFFGSALRAD